MVKGIERRIKTYVDVIALHKLDGSVMPLSVVWEDGTEYKIAKVLDWRRAESLKVGGVGTRYLVRIKGRETYLFYEKPRWFVEQKVYSEAYEDYQYGIVEDVKTIGKRAQ